MDFNLNLFEGAGFNSFSFGLDTILYRLTTALLLCFVLGFLYRFSKKTLKITTDISVLIYFTGPIICMILLAIGSSVPRAFGLFAALSLVRFRSPVTDRIDMALLFLSIAIGIGCGSGALLVSVVGTLLLGGFFIIFVLAKSNEEQLPAHYFELLFPTQLSQSIKKILENKDFKSNITVHSLVRDQKKESLFFSFKGSYPQAETLSKSISALDENVNVNFKTIGNTFLDEIL